MKRNFKKLIVMILAIVLVMSQVAYAKSEMSNGKKQPPGQLKKMENFQEIDGNRIKVNNNNLKFDVPPVIKGGRTLIPVRAITEALGCTVVWDSPFAYIVSPDKNKVFVFDLSSGSVFAFNAMTLVQIDALTSWDAYEVTIDARPEIHNNRTFVPLRFIAEQLGLKVGYDDKTGNIDIDVVPELIPAKYTKDEFGSLNDVVITMKLNGYSFVGIEGLALTTQYTLSTDNKVTLLKSYMDSLQVVQTKLNFVFTKGDLTEKKVFTINLDYLSDVPSLKQTTTTFDKNDVVKASTAEMNLNGFVLSKLYTSISVILTQGEPNVADYKLATDLKSVTFSPTYLNTLAVGTHVIYFEFVQGVRTVVLNYTIVVREDQPTVSPTTVTTYVVGSNIEYIVDYKGYSFSSLKNVTSDVTLVSGNTGNYKIDNTYNVSDDIVKVIVQNSYLSTLAPGTYTLKFNFTKGTVEKNVEVMITVVAPVL